MSSSVSSSNVPLWLRPVFNGLSSMMLTSSRVERLRNADSIYRSCKEQASRHEFLTNLSISKDSFLKKHQIITLHVWFAHRYLMSRDEEGEAIKSQVYEYFWEDTERRLRGHGIKEISISKNLRDMQTATVSALRLLDEGVHAALYANEASDEYDVEKLREAVTTIFYGEGESVDSKKTDALVSYVLDELSALSRMDAGDVFVGRFCWGEPPLATKEQIEAAQRSREDPWKPAIDVFGKEYWFHANTKEARWEKP